MDIIEEIKDVNGALKEYVTIVDSTHASKKNVTITYLRHSSKVSRQTISVSDYFFKLISIGNVPFIYGI